MQITEKHRDRLQQELNTTKLEGLTKFMLANRQTGSTTALVKAAVEADGYLIVGKQDMVRVIIKNHPEINPERVLSIQQIRIGTWKFDPRPVFIDTTAIWGMK